jgi:hypothetical protein
MCGCSGSSAPDDAQLQVHRARLLLQTEPAGVMSVLDVQEDLRPDAEVVVIGRIGGLENPFTKNRASFVMVDPAVLAADEHVCDSPDCPHCAKIKQQKQLQATALVEFLDEQGQPVRVDAQRLFGLQTGQTVVVRGRAKLNELNNLVITADGLFVRE